MPYYNVIIIWYPCSYMYVKCAGIRIHSVLKSRVYICEESIIILSHAPLLLCQVDDKIYPHDSGRLYM